MLAYSVARPADKKEFTEFYILGLNGKASEYPVKFTITNNKVIDVQYSDTDLILHEQWGRVILGIVNHNKKEMYYDIAIMINGEQTNFIYSGNIITKLTGLKLQQDETWEGEIRFAPLNTGDKQKIEFLLYENTKTQNLRLWIDVK